MATPENQKVRKGRKELGEMLRAKRPELNVDDDDEFYGAIGDEFDESADYRTKAEEYRTRHDEADKVLNGMFNSDPRSADFFVSWSKTGTPVPGLLRTYGKEIRDAIDDPEKMDEWEKEDQAYKERIAEDEKLQEEYKANLQKSLEGEAEVMEKNNLTDEQMDAAYGLLLSIAKNVTSGVFAPDQIMMAVKALGYESAVAEAKEEGEITGRNDQIENRLRTGKRTDGMPGFQGEGRMPAQQAPQQPQQNLGALSRYDGNQRDIFARGNEKRRR